MAQKVVVVVVVAAEAWSTWLVLPAVRHEQFRVRPNQQPRWYRILRPVVLIMHDQINPPSEEITQLLKLLLCQGRQQTPVHLQVKLSQRATPPFAFCHNPHWTCCLQKNRSWWWLSMRIRSLHSLHPLLPWYLRPQNRLHRAVWNTDTPPTLSITEVQRYRTFRIFVPIQWLMQESFVALPPAFIDVNCIRPSIRTMVSGLWLCCPGHSCDHIWPSQLSRRLLYCWKLSWSSMMAIAVFP